MIKRKKGSIALRSCINTLDRLRVPPIRRFADEKLEGVGAVVLDRHFLIDGHGDDTIEVARSLSIVFIL